MTDIELHVRIIGWHFVIADLYLILLALLGLELDTTLGSTPDRMLCLLLTIQINLVVTATSHVEQHLVCLLRTEHGFIFCREAHQLHIRSEGVLTIGRYLHRILLLGDDNRLAFHLAIVPESALKAHLAIHATLVEVRIQNLVVHQVASIKGDNLVFLQTTPDTIQDGNCLSWSTIIVSPHHRFVIHIRSDESNLLYFFIERQNLILVLEQRHGLQSHIERELAMRLAAKHRYRNLRP